MVTDDAPLDDEMHDLMTILNEHGRRLADPTDLQPVDRSWHPANGAAERLWRCVEATRDVSNLLEGMGDIKTEAERRRRLKHLATPTYNLLVAVRDLANCLMSEQDVRSRLSHDDRKTLGQLSQMMTELMSLEAGQPIRTVRDKLSAHIDRKLRPAEACDLLMAAPASLYGARLHQSVYILTYLTSFDVYAWSAGDAPEGCDRLMTCEPFGVLLRRDAVGRLALLDIEVSRSPRLDVEIACRQLVRASEWMFMPGQARIMWRNDGEPVIDVLQGESAASDPGRR